MAHYAALYHPLVHFRSENWVKSMALYWDELYRMVPYDYMLHDSETIREFSRLGFIQPAYLGSARDEVGGPFIELIRENADALRERYGLKDHSDWPDYPITVARNWKGADPKLAYVVTTEYALGHLEEMEEAGLIESAPQPGWIGMHPRLAQIFMVAVANKIARTQGYYPATDQELDFLLIHDLTVEQLGAILLHDIKLSHQLSPPAVSKRASESKLLTFALNAVQPNDLASYSPEEIIAYRRDHKAELSAFQAHLHGLVQNIAGLEIEDAARSKEVIRDFGEKLQESVKQQRKNLTSRRRSTAVTVGMAVSALVAEPVMMAITKDPNLAKSASMAIEAVPIARTAQSELRPHASVEPWASYLLSMESKRGPRSLLKRINQVATRNRVA